MSARLIVEGTDAERRRRITKMAENGGVPVADREAAIRELLAHPNIALKPSFQRAVENMRQQTGVYSLAGSARGVLMWSHHVRDHTGVCLQFETARDFMTLSRAVIVEYEPDYPILNWIVDFHNAIGDVLLREHPDWSYEHETRIIVRGEAGKYIRFLPAALRSIIFGSRPDEHVMQTFAQLLAERRLAGYPAVALYRTTPHKGMYLLVIRELSGGPLGIA